MPERISLGRISELMRHQPRIVAYSQGQAPKISIIVLQTDQGVRAYWNVCQHLPVPLDAGAGTCSDGDGLVCVTHGAHYRAEDGLCVRGPCVGRSLEAVAIEVDVDNDQMWVTLSPGDRSVGSV